MNFSRVSTGFSVEYGGNSCVLVGDEMPLLIHKVEAQGECRLCDSGSEPTPNSVYFYYYYFKLIFTASSNLFYVLIF